MQTLHVMSNQISSLQASNAALSETISTLYSTLDNGNMSDMFQKQTQCQPYYNLYLITNQTQTTLLHILYLNNQQNQHLIQPNTNHSLSSQQP